MREWSSADVEVDGARLHYHRTGGRGPAVVMLHGHSDAGLCMSRIAREVEGEYDIVMPDARGHGLSERAHGHRDNDTLATDAAGLMRALGLGKAALIGHSMGAATAAGVAGTEPELVACLILEDPPWRDGDMTGRRGDFESVRRAQALPADQVLDFARSLHPTWEEIDLVPRAEALRRYDLSLLEGSRPTPRPWREVVAAIRCPTLLITGDSDLGAIVTPEVAAEASRLGPVRVQHIEGADHSIRRERWPQYRAAVVDFLHDVYPPAREGTSTAKA